MKYYYSPATSGFYLEPIHTNIPEDALEITEERYVSLVEGQTRGQVIVYKARKIQLVDFVPPEVTWDQIRERRDALLSQCDWTQLPDNALDEDTRETWRQYRQTLRDITKTATKASKIVWPLSPNEMEAQ